MLEVLISLDSEVLIKLAFKNSFEQKWPLFPEHPGGRGLQHVRSSDRLIVNDSLMLTFDGKTGKIECTCSRQQKHVTCNHQEECEGGVDVLFWWSNVRQWQFLHLCGERNLPVISLFIPRCLFFSCISFNIIINACKAAL